MEGVISDDILPPPPPPPPPPSMTRIDVGKETETEREEKKR